MASEREQYMMMKRQAEKMRKGYEPWKARAIEEEAEEMRQRLVYYEDLHQEVINNSTDKVKASLLWAEIFRQAGGNVMQQVSTLLSALYTAGLLTDSQFHEGVKKLRFTPSVGMQARQAEKDEIQRINDTFEDIMKTVQLGNRDAALYEYNKLDGFRTMDKLNTWCKKLVELGFLPKSYVFGARVGKAAEKMLHPGSNKEMKVGSNK